MGIRYDIDAKDLLSFVSLIDREMPKRVDVATSMALNELGNALVNDIKQSVAQQTGLSDNDIQEMLITKPATPADLTYMINTRLLGSLDDNATERAMPQRGFPAADDPTNQKQLVSVVTMEDDDVCPICEAIAEGGPYTMLEAATNIHHGSTIGKNNCRCILVPFQRRGRLSAQLTTPRINNLGRRVNTRELVRESLSKMAQRIRTIGDVTKIKAK